MAVKVKECVAMLRLEESPFRYGFDCPKILDSFCLILASSQRAVIAATHKPQRDKMQRADCMLPTAGVLFHALPE